MSSFGFSTTLRSDFVAEWQHRIAEWQRVCINIFA